MLSRSRTTLVPFLILAVLAAACAIVPITGRRQISMIPTSTLNAMSFDQYSAFLHAHQVSGNTEKTAMVRRVGHRLQGAVERFFREQGNSRQLAGYQWEFQLIEDKQVNAWCMPGGKVVVYTGILPVARDEAGLAVVLAHEIAHAVANHGNERMSQALLTQLGGMALEKALESRPEETSSIFLAAFGAGVQVGVLLPYSRLHESEADRLGLIFMAMAGYDPHEAVGFWQRMAEMKQGTAPPEFLSTHPSDQTRIRKIREQIPEAMRYYNPR